MLEVIVIKLWIVGLFLSSVLAYKRKQTAFYCGIFGASLKPKLMDEGMTKAAIAKMKILGLYNESRGKHSCGVYMADVIQKGVDDKKLFSDFIVKEHLPFPEQGGNYTMMGHDRAATHGGHTSDNAHPFEIDNEFILVHNGVIRNIWSICNKYKVDHKGIPVDSHGLAKLIHQEGFKVLEEYEGFAALLMARRSEPNSLYVFRGVSKKWAGGQLEEERPLYMLKTKEGIYFSSIPASLLAISDTEGDEITEVEPNIVHKVTNGVMTKVKFSVNRAESTVNYGTHVKSYSSPNSMGTRHTATSSSSTTSTGTGSIQGTNTARTATNCSVGNSYSAGSQSRGSIENVVPIEWHETLPARVTRYKDKMGVFYHCGRYWVVNKETIELADGPLYVNKRGFANIYKENNSHNYFFYQGVMLKGLQAYRKAVSDSSLRSDMLNFSHNISQYADYPISNSRANVVTGCKNVSDFNKYKWYRNQNMCKNDGFTPKFSDRNYIIHDGILEAIKTQKGTAEERTVDYDTYTAEYSVRNPNRPLPNPSASAVKVIMPQEMDKAIQNKFNFTDEEVDAAGDPKIDYGTPPPFHVKETLRGGRGSKEEIDVTNFYKHYNSVSQMWVDLTTEELLAIRFYVADIMRQEMGVKSIDNVIVDDQVTMQVNMFFTLCVENDVSPYDQWETKNYGDIMDYILIARDAPEGNYMEETTFEDVAEAGESCEFVPKPKEEELPPVINMHLDAYQETLKTIKQNIQDGHVQATVCQLLPPKNIYEDGPNYHDKEGDEPEIDQMVRKEFASIPTENGIVDVHTDPDEEELFEHDDEERTDVLRDIVDDLATLRESADELQTRENDDFAQEAARVIYEAADEARERLSELAYEYQEQEITKYINLMEGKDDTV